MFKALRNAFSRDSKAQDPSPIPAEAEAEAGLDAAALESWIAQWIAEKSNRDASEVKSATWPDAAFSDFGLDSLTAVKLSGDLEQLLGRPLSPSIAWEFATVAELAAYLAEGGSGSDLDMDEMPEGYGAEERAAPAGGTARG